MVASSPIAIDFPLRGEWAAFTTPAHTIPSHGTHSLGQTYAFDFAALGWAYGRPKSFHRRTVVDYWLGRVRLEDCYGWSLPVHAPFDGKVVVAEDGWPERRRVSILDILGAIKNAFRRQTTLQAVAGNYIILEGPGFYAFIAHARTHSIRVSAGDTVRKGQVLCEVGHSGNSTAPHLHFHLMDSADIWTASGLPCCFKSYEIHCDEGWVAVDNGIPERRVRLRSRP